MLNRATVCLLTTGQPSTNPRLLKEADALAEDGYKVHVIYSHWADWADLTDRKLLSERSWTYTRVGGCPNRQYLRYWWTRLRHGLGRRMQSHRGTAGMWEKAALSRTTPELEAAATDFKADLYIAHNLGALPAVVAGAKRNNALAAFDAEDFHTDCDPQHPLDREHQNAERIERRFLRACSYVTAASPGIAEAYAEKYGVPPPKTILNVFPLRDRPPAFRAGEPSAALKLYWFSQTIGRGRGLENLVRAMGLLKDRSIELHLRGDWSAGYRASLLGLAASIGIAEKAIYHHRPAAPNRMIELAAQYDVGLAPEPRRSFNNDICISNKIFTYLLAGNAIAATNTRGQQAVIDRIGQAGFCYEPGDVNRLAAGLQRWDDDRRMLERARQHAWNLGCSEYNWDLEKSKFLEIVRAALKRQWSEPANASTG